MPRPLVQPRAKPHVPPPTWMAAAPRGSGRCHGNHPFFLATRLVPDPGEEAAFARSGPPQAVSLRVCPPRRVFLFSSSALMAPSRFLPRAPRMVRDGRELSPLPRARSRGGNPSETCIPPQGCHRRPSPRCHCEQPGCSGCLTSTKNEKHCALVIRFKDF